MELIREAVSKARASLDRPDRSRPERLVPAPPLVWQSQKPGPAPSWNIPSVRLNPAQLERNRIVSFAANEPGYIAFNLLRTKTFKALKDNGWKTLAVTSPTPACGKTMVAINLALSLARQSTCRTVLVDLDLKKPSVALTLRISPPKSLGEYLDGKAALEECFVRVGENLMLGLNTFPIRDSAEMMQHERLIHMLGELADSVRPDVVVFDLPPMSAGDDVIAFLPRIDACLLTIAAGSNTATEVDECERQIGAASNLLGVVLNKQTGRSQDYYY